MDGPATVVTLATGAVLYTSAAADGDTARVLNAEFEITWVDGKKQTLPNDAGHPCIQVGVVEDLS
jgi:hypothetical protein